MNANDITIDLFSLLNYRANLIVPNVSWGLFPNREVDMLKVTKSGYAHEYEIKVSASDLKRDHLKLESRKQVALIRTKTYVMPAAMSKHITEIPVECGIILINEESYPKQHIRGRFNVYRDATVNSQARKLTAGELYQVARLGAMRVPGLMEKVRKGLV